MKYKVTIERITEVEGKNYPDKEVIFEQTGTAEDEVEFVKGVVAQINGLVVPL